MEYQKTSQPKFQPGIIVEIDPASRVDTVWPINGTKLKGSVHSGDLLEIRQVIFKSACGIPDIQLKFKEKGGFNYSADFFRVAVNTTRTGG